ncbi:MAG: hypothetical protein EP329_09195 [Deltaproteobacteria bacterium]|nr:MAG: hypothetical protein EP329_09195 [Deltaproteobacteria bacterium]
MPGRASGNGPARWRVLRTMRWWIPCVVVWGVVSWLVLRPGDASGGGLPIPDKVAHLLAWLGLALTAWPALSASTRWRRATRAWAVVGACTAYAVATEALQAGVPGRTSDALDAAADVAGAVLGVAVWWLFESRRAATTRGQTTS